MIEKFKYHFNRYEMQTLLALLENSLMQTYSINMPLGNNPAMVLIFDRLVKSELNHLRIRVRNAIEKTMKVEYLFTLSDKEAMSFFAAFGFGNHLTTDADRLIYKISLKIDAAKIWI